MFDKFKRTNFMDEVVVNGILEMDLLKTNWDLFELNYPITYGVITPLDIQRPDYLSYRLYGTSEYWWLLCKVNSIDDIWNDMYVGKKIITPNVNDFITFYNNVKKRYRE